MIRRDRNHASIAFWSIGNEIAEAISPRGVELATQMRAAIREHDTSRFITQAITASYAGTKGEAARAQLDVTSYNYSFDAVEKDSAAYPNLTFSTTETHSKDAWDIKQHMDRNPAYMGEFLWTGLDYIGEVGSGSSRLRSNAKPPEEEKKIIFGMDVSMLNFYVWDYPAYQAGSGEIDLIGLKKPPSHYRDVVWGRSKLELFVQRPVPEGYHEDQTAWGWPDLLASWTWTPLDGQPMTIHMYSSADEVALLLNGKEVGRKRMAPADKLKAQFQVPYQPGTLLAVAPNGRQTSAIAAAHRTCGDCRQPRRSWLRLRRSARCRRPPGARRSGAFDLHGLRGWPTTRRRLRQPLRHRKLPGYPHPQLSRHRAGNRPTGPAAGRGGHPRCQPGPTPGHDHNPDPELTERPDRC